MSINRTTKFADWVAYKVTPSTIGTTRNRNWKTDPAVPDEFELEPSDYKRANTILKTDRGHQVPLASFTGTPHWRQTNFLTNITPQKSNLNQGSWKRLENAVRRLAKTSGSVFVITGPLYEADQEQMVLPGADEPHMVPTGYFKVVSSNSSVTAFIFDQDVTRKYSRCSAIVTIAEIERRAGLDLFPEINSEIFGSLNGQLGC